MNNVTVYIYEFNIGKLLPISNDIKITRFTAKSHITAKFGYSHSEISSKSGMKLQISLLFQYYKL